MTIEKLKSLEPIFGSYYVEDKVTKSKNSVLFKVKASDSDSRPMALKVIKFPASNEEISRAIDSGLYSTVDEYLSFAEKSVCENIEKMMSLKGNKNIVDFYDYTVIKESSCFYVLVLTELLTPLSEYIKENLVRHKDVVKIGWDICNALEIFRSAGIMHRNIKSENIFVGHNTGCKLGDFGIDDINRRKSGKSSYNAPELYTDAEDTSSDIYSLGIVLYRLLNNNRAPFLPEYPAPVSLSDRERAAERRLRGDLFPAPANADSGLAHIIFTATAFRPRDRYTSPDQLKQALEGYVKNILSTDTTAATTTASVAKAHPVSSTVPKAQKSSGAASVTNKDKAAFAEAFKDDDSEEEKNGNSFKKWYLLLGILAIILAVLVAVLIKGFSDTDDGLSAIPNFSPSYYDTTSESSPEETTSEITEESTTEETSAETTQETTEEETTEETTQEETTEETTAEQTTEEATTEATTEEVTTEATTEPSTSSSLAGTADSYGRVYYDLTDYKVIYTPQNPTDIEFIIELNGTIGSNPVPGNKAYIYMHEGGMILERSELYMTIIPGDDNSYLCRLSIVDENFYYQPGESQYYILLTAGAIESDSTVNTETKIEV